MLKPFLCHVSRWVLLAALAVAALVALPAYRAEAVPYFLTKDDLFEIRAFKLDTGSGSNDHDLNDTNETLTIWNAIDGGAVVPGNVIIGSKNYWVRWWETDTETVVDYAGGGGNFGVNTPYSTINSDGPGGSGGDIVDGDDFSVRALTYLAVPIGTWSIAIASDDGRRIRLPGLAALSTSGFVAIGGQTGLGGVGNDFVGYNATTGHNNTVGVFTVGVADLVPGTDIALLALDGFFFERNGGDSLEISIKSGWDTGFGGSGDGWQLLQDGAQGWAISSTPIVVNLTPPVNSFTWDGSTDDWRAGAGSDTHWEPPAVGNPLFATIADDATVNAGQAQVSSSNEAVLNLNIGGAGAVSVAPGRSLVVDSILTISPGGALANSGTINALLLASAGTIAMNGGSSLTALGGTLGDVDVVTGTASLNGVLTASTLDFAASTTLALTGGSLAVPAVTLAGGGTGTMDVASGLSVTLSNISGAGGLTKAGAGTLTLNTANSYSGQTTINGGILLMTNAGALGDTTSGTVVNSGGQLRLQGGFTIPAAEPISINGAANGGAIYNLSSDHNIDGPVTLAGGSTIRVDNNRLRLRGGLSLGGNGLTAEVDGGTALEINTSPITGTGTLTKEGDGTLDIRVGSPAYTGQININNGVLDTNRGLGTGSMNIDGDATLRLRGNVTVGRNITLNGTAGGGLGEGSQGRIRNDADSNTLSGSIAVNSNSRVAVDAGTTLALSGPLSGGGNIEKTDTGTLVLSGNNNFSGALAVAGGTLRVESSSALGTTAGGTSLTGGAALQLQGGISVPAEPLSLGSANSSGESIVSLGGANSFAGNITLGPGTNALPASSATINTQAGSLTLGGNIDMNYSNLTVTGAGDATIQGIISGTNLATISTTPGLLGGHQPGNPDWGPNSGNLGIVLGPFGGRSSAEHWSDVIGPDTSTLVYTGQIYLDGGPTTFVESIDDRTRLIIDGTTVLDNGTWNDTTHGTLTRAAGWYDMDLRFSNGGGGYGPVQQDGWTASFGFGIDVNGNDNEDEANFVFPLDPGDATLFRLATFANPNDLIKSGTGTLTLNGNNSYVGTTDVQQGALLILGTTSGQGSYTVNAGAILGGPGTIGLAGGNSVTIQGGGTIAPGLSPGTLTIVGDLSMANGSVYEWESGTTVEDLIALSGNLDLNDWTLRILDAGGDTYSWQKHYIFTGFSSLSGPNNVTFDLSQVPHWAQFTTSLELGIDGGGMYLTGLNSIPEPGALALLALGGLALLRRRKRSR